MIEDGLSAMNTINVRLIHFLFLTVLLGTNLAVGQTRHVDKKRRPDGHVLHTANMIALVTPDDSQPTAEIKFHAMRFGRRPLVYLSFDVILRNHEKSARWFLLPSNLGSGHAAVGEKGGVDTLEVFSPRGNGHVVVGRFLGTGGFNALLLPADAVVRLRVFPISYWGEPPAKLQVEIVIAKQLKIGGDTAENWFGESPMSSVTADIPEDAENPMTMRTSKRTPDKKEVAPLIDEDRRLRLQISLEKKNQ